MFVIDKNKKIILTKGDTASMFIEVKYIDETPYEINNEDTITMMVRKTPSSDAVITKIADEEHYLILNPEDTNTLNTGLYIYDVQLETKNGNIYTIVPESYFEIRSEVTR